MSKDMSTEHFSPTNRLSMNRNNSVSIDSPLIPTQVLEASSRQTNEMENNQLESVINNYHRLNTQLPQNGFNSWLQSFFELMRSEWTRLRTYNARETSKWSLDFVSPEELANAGFFFLNDDRVQCAFCRGIVSGWEPGDRPLAEHARHFPRCPFIMEEDVGNVPISHDPIRGPKRSIGHDVCGNYTPAMMNPVLSSINPVRDENALAIDMREYGVQPHRGPKNPSFKSIDSRRNSFRTNCWDNSIPVSVESLSEAGFFSIGMSDYVKCFNCDGGLCNWESGDDPWVEHAKWFPDCEFIRLNRSVSFIETCKQLGESESHSNGSNGSNGYSDNSSEHELVSNSGSDSDSDSNDTLGLRVVNEWMNTDIVLQLVDLNAFSIDVIKAVLNQRWHRERRPFASFSELYDAVSQWRNHNIIQNQIEPLMTQNLEISDDQSSGDDECSSIPSSQSSLSSTTSSLSPSMSSSPPESSLESAYSDSSVTRESRLLCKICFDREIGVVFLPCGHQLACTQCAPCITDCPVCRKVIRGTVRTFF